MFTRATRLRCHHLLALLSAGVCGVAISGCGSSGRKPSASSPAPTKLAYSDCMRGHGVPGFPDPSPGGGINIEGTGSPSFEAAETTCQKLLRGGRPPAQATEQQKLQLLAISRCIRGHGVSGFPDPRTATPPSNPQEYSIAVGFGLGSGDSWLLVPRTINVDSAVFRQAANACSFNFH